MLNLIAIKMPKGYYISSNDNYCFNIQRYKFDGKYPEKTFNNSWFFIPEYPKSITEKKSQPNINFRFEICDEKLITQNIPRTFSVEEVTLYKDDEYYVWKDEYKHLQKLYNYVSDSQEPIDVEVEFEIGIIYEADHEATEPISLEYNIQRRESFSKEIVKISNESLRHRLIDEIMVSTLYIHEHPCKLSSMQVYDIVRQYIKENIDPKVAVVSSDYDFCFAVSKRIMLTVPKAYVINVNAGTKKKSKEETRYHTYKDVPIFSMTQDKDKYKGYAVISGVEGNNEADLKEKMDAFLLDIISFINEPVKECPHCEGKGHIYSEFNLNKTT